jgi:hypothetical protein
MSVMGMLAIAGSAIGTPGRETTAVSVEQMTDAPVSSNALPIGHELVAAQESWRASMKSNPVRTRGCFHASYPDPVWEPVDCAAGQPRAHSVHIKPSNAVAEVAGDGNDFAAVGHGLISGASGVFGTKNLTNVSSFGVARFGGGGILGPNEYSIQINTNNFETTSVCAGHSDCTVWQQFIYSPDYFAKGTAAVFMQYWLLNWGNSSACPATWTPFKSDCWKNSASASAPDVPIQDLGDVELTGKVESGGLDVVTFTYAGEAYTATGDDSVLDIASVWMEAEFNVVGNGGGSDALFNSGASLTAYLALSDGTSSAPDCEAQDGTTGETNNLVLGECTSSGFMVPWISFTETSPPSPVRHK